MLFRSNDAVKELNDINGREFAILAILALAVLIVGMYPQPVIEVMHASIENLLQQGLNSKL